MPAARRDRDEAGNPRNARPRDALGRPLPYGSPGVEPIPDNLHLSPAEALATAQQLLDAGRPFAAHEVLEASWKSAPEAERDLWQGLAQLAVALTHGLRGNLTGACTLADRSRTKLRGYVTGPDQPGPHDIDLAGLLSWLADARQVWSGTAATTGELAPPRLVSDQSR